MSHEALIREWPWLRHWLEEGREDLQIYRNLSETVREWELLGREPVALYRGTKLDQAREWAAVHPEEPNALEKAFFNASYEAMVKAEREKEGARRHTLLAANGQHFVMEQGDEIELAFPGFTALTDVARVWVVAEGHYVSLAAER